MAPFDISELDSQFTQFDRSMLNIWSSEGIASRSKWNKCKAVAGSKNCDHCGLMKETVVLQSTTILHLIFAYGYK
jgi:hypothetical protein